jgi:hypothetical protein
MDYLNHPLSIQFAQDLKNAGYNVNPLTLLDNRTVLATYASIQSIRHTTRVPLTWKNMGFLQVIYPKIE